MNLTQRKTAEEKVLKTLEPLNDGEKAILYKQLNAEGYRLSECDTRISQSPPGASTPAPVDASPWAYGFIV